MILNASEYEYTTLTDNSGDQFLRNFRWVTFTFPQFYSFLLVCSFQFWIKQCNTLPHAPWRRTESFKIQPNWMIKYDERKSINIKKIIP